MNIQDLTFIGQAALAEAVIRTLRNSREPMGAASIGTAAGIFRGDRARMNDAIVTGILAMLQTQNRVIHVRKPGMRGQWTIAPEPTPHKSRRRPSRRRTTAPVKQGTP